MSWLTRVRQSIPFLPKRETPENLWHKCRGCGQMVFVKEFEDNLHVCPKCEFHERIGAKIRFRQILDLGTCAIIPAQKATEDPLKFRDTKKYVDRLKTARSETGEVDALVNARGRLDGHKVIVGVQNFAFMGGSMGIAVGAAFVAGIRAAIDEHQFRPRILERKSDCLKFRRELGERADEIQRRPFHGKAFGLRRESLQRNGQRAFADAVEHRTEVFAALHENYPWRPVLQPFHHVCRGGRRMVAHGKDLQRFAGRAFDVVDDSR